MFTRILIICVNPVRRSTPKDDPFPAPLEGTHVLLGFIYVFVSA